MRLLYFTAHQIWPINTGARLRDYQLARQLAARFSVTVVEMRHAGEEHTMPPDGSGLASVLTLDKGRTYSAFKILRGLAGPTPVTVLNCWSFRLASELADVLRSRQFDTVQIEGMQLMKYLPVIRKAPGCPATVVDWHNIESELMWRYAKTARNPLKRVAAGRVAIAEVEDLLREKQIGPLTGFRSRLGRPFAAVLKLTNEHKLEFDFGNSSPGDDEVAVDFSGLTALGACPKCGAHVYEQPMAYLCEKSVGPGRTCDFRSGKVILQQAIEPEQMRKLLAEGRTDLLRGFVSNKTRRKFSAYLVKQPGGKVGFEFEQRAPRCRSGSQKPWNFSGGLRAAHGVGGVVLVGRDAAV